MYFNRFCKEAETENLEMARWRVLVFDTMTTALARALMFLRNVLRWANTRGVPNMEENGRWEG